MWIGLGSYFGTPRNWIGFENLAIMCYDDRELVEEIVETIANLQYIWNEANARAFRSFCMVYPTRDGVLDTIAWEGLRVGLDDVRYATKLKTLARAAIASGKIENVYAARKALVWLEECDAATADLETTRMEMVRHIVDLHECVEGPAS